jgi:hypothetical protein
MSTPGILLEVKPPRFWVRNCTCIGKTNQESESDDATELHFYLIRKVARGREIDTPNVASWAAAIELNLNKIHITTTEGVVRNIMVLNDKLRRHALCMS